MIVRGTLNFFAFSLFITDILSRAVLSACTVYGNTLIGLANFESLGIRIDCTVSMTCARYLRRVTISNYFNGGTKTDHFEKLVRNEKKKTISLGNLIQIFGKSRKKIVGPV